MCNYSGLLVYEHQFQTRIELEQEIDKKNQEAIAEFMTNKQDGSSEAADVEEHIPESAESTKL